MKLVFVFPASDRLFDPVVDLQHDVLGRVHAIHCIGLREERIREACTLLEVERGFARRVVKAVINDCLHKRRAGQ